MPAGRSWALLLWEISPSAMQKPQPLRYQRQVPVSDSADVGVTALSVYLLVPAFHHA
jgi:hypothetical protein